MSVHSFVAHFLKDNGYLETLKTFEAEHGKQITTELPHDESLTDIITDRLKYLSTEPQVQDSHDKILDEELRSIKEKQFKEWAVPFPNVSHEIAKIDDLVIDSAIMHFDNKNYLILATSARELVVVDIESSSEVFRRKNVIGDVVIRKIAVTSNAVVLCGMQGKAFLCKFSHGMLELNIEAERQIHARLVVDVKVVSWREQDYLVSLGWDYLVKVFKIEENDICPVGEPFKLANQGSCMDACVYKDRITVLVGKSEITLMDVLCMGEEQKLSLDCRIALNDAEFSAAGFTPMCVRIHQSGENVPLVAVGTSHEPFMRAVIVTLKQVGIAAQETVQRNQIIANLNTLSPQDKYSQAILDWRPDGTGLWVLGDDGVIRGIDLSSGKVSAELSGHEGRIKTLNVLTNLLVSCGTDRHILKWT